MRWGSMSASLLGGLAELEGEVDEPLDLLRAQPAGEAGHRAVALDDALADGRAVTLAHHGRGDEIEIRVAVEIARISAAVVAVAAGAGGAVERGRGEVLGGTTGERHRREEQGRAELQGSGLGRLPAVHQGGGRLV